MKKRIAQIKAGHFTAGLLAEDEVVSHAAPIIKYMVGWKYRKVIEYCSKKGWDLQSWDVDKLL